MTTPAEPDQASDSGDLAPTDLKRRVVEALDALASANSDLDGLLQAIKAWSSCRPIGQDCQLECIYYGLRRGPLNVQDEREEEEHVQEESFSGRNLCPDDKFRVKSLQRLTTDLGVDVFLANLRLERTEIGPLAMEEVDSDADDSENEDVANSTSVELTSLFDCEGTLLADGLELDGNDKMLLECFDREGAEEETDGFYQKDQYVGLPNANSVLVIHQLQGCDTQIVYYNTGAVIIIPRVSTVTLLSSSFGSGGKSDLKRAARLLDSYASKCLGSACPKSDLELFGALCFKSVEGHDPVPVELGLRLFRIALQFRDAGLFDLVCEELNGSTFTPEFLGWIGQYLPGSGLSAKKLETPLLRSILACRGFKARYLAISSLSQKGTSASAELKDICSSAYDHCIQELSTRPAEHDGYDVVEMIAADATFDSLDESFAFLLGILTKLFEYACRENPLQERALDTYQDTAQRLINAFKVGFVTSHGDRSPDRPVYWRKIRPGSLANFFTDMLNLNLRPLAEELVCKVADQVSSIDSRELIPVYLPFLGRLLHPLNQTSFDKSFDIYQRLFRELLERVRGEGVGFDLYRAPIPDDISPDYVQLNKFLTNRHQKEWRFRAPKFDCDDLVKKLEEAKAKTDCGHRLTHTSPCWTLEIWKTFSDYASAKADSDKRKLEAKKALNSFDQEKMATLLGDQYQRIIMLEGTSDPFVVPPTVEPMPEYHSPHGKCRYADSKKAAKLQPPPAPEGPIPRTQPASRPAQLARQPAPTGPPHSNTILVKPFKSPEANLPEVWLYYQQLHQQQYPMSMPLDPQTFEAHGQYLPARAPAFAQIATRSSPNQPFAPAQGQTVPRYETPYPVGRAPVSGPDAWKSMFELVPQNGQGDQLAQGQDKPPGSGSVAPAAGAKRKRVEHIDLA
ncbi:Uu.00g038300.m01.CDS01 [Anthostomella pinea]|uniref:Uu.00g038300.m01.CDS01 n=1 Tax=Anthostomella pinea TaxID=933095 RepID=A0AAI8VAA7_9PEZI|nr:Uu.00g038300.m01.CDS01 [Anthostomella pinea]